MADRVAELDRLGARLGNGARGAVFECVINGQPAALKVYFEEKFFHQERLAYENICHGNLDGQITPQYIGQVHLTRQSRYIVWCEVPRFQINPQAYSFELYPYGTAIAMELMSGVTLRQVSMRNIGDEQIKLIAADLSKKLGVLHVVAGVCHRDLSWDNVMVDGSFDLLSAKEVQPRQVRIIDFSEALVSSASSKEYYSIRCLKEAAALEALVKLVLKSRPYHQEISEHEEQKMAFEVTEEEGVKDESADDADDEGGNDDDDDEDDDDEGDNDDDDDGDEDDSGDDDLNREAEHSYMSDDDSY